MSLIATPLLVAGAMSGIEHWRQRRSVQRLTFYDATPPLVTLVHFYLFAMAFALVRHFCTR
jgi:hypothetical protein